MFDVCVIMYRSWCLGVLLTGQGKDESTATSVTPSHSSTRPAYGSSDRANEGSNSKEKAHVSNRAIAQLLMQV